MSEAIDPELAVRVVGLVHEPEAEHEREQRAERRSATTAMRVSPRKSATSLGRSLRQRERR